MFITIDPYYDIKFYNETKEALRNNGVEFNEYISTKPPYHYYLETNADPSFINYDVVPESYSKFLVNIVKPLIPNEDYLYERRESYTNIKAIEYYAVNDALGAAQISGQGIFFNGTKEEVLRISKDYPRKIYFMGRYFNRKYRLFFTDNLIIRNYLNEANILVQSKKFKHITELEVQLNFNIFHEKDRLKKLVQTPYIQKGQYYPIQSIRADMQDMFVLS